MAKSSSELTCKTCGKQFTRAVGYNRHLAVCGIHLSDDTFEWSFVSIVRNESACEDPQPKVCENSTNETAHEDSFSRDISNQKFVVKSDLTNHLKKPKSHNKLLKCAECSKKFFSKKSLSIHIFRAHTIKSSKLKYFKKESMVCKICAAKYKTKKAFSLHMKKCIKQSSPSFKCSKCKKTFADRQNLKRHKNTIHQTKENGFQCTMCKKSFNRMDNFKRHTESCKNRLIIDYFTCHYCGHEFSRKNSIKWHILRKHQNWNTHKCEICGANFRGISAEFALKRHVREYHIDDNLIGSLKCALCIKAFYSRDNILYHLIEEHDMTIRHEHLAFPSLNQFKEWKANLEKSSLTFFRNRRGFTNSKKYSISIFECHRSGCYQPKTDDRKRRIKLQGTKKIGSYCPAEIGLRINKSDGSCRVSFTNMHLGHNVGDKNELAFLYVPRDERARIASKISSGFSYDEILKEHALTKKNQLYLLTRKDLNNISRAFNVKEKPVESSTVVDLESFVQKHEKSIVFLKRSGETNDSNECFFDRKDFFMVVMTEKQKNVLQEFGSKVISVDGTFTVSNRDFLLLTLLIIDDYHEGVPVAFAISSRMDFALVDVFLNSIRKEVGPLNTELFMSDIEFDYYEKWREIMGAAENRPFCKWYVPETWRRKLRKISDSAKRTQTRDRFCEIIIQLDKNLFCSEIKEFFANTDPDLEEFLRVLKSFHFEEIENWANCLRENAEANTNMHVESLNRKLRYFYGKLAKTKTLSTLLTVVDNYLNLNECDWKRKEIKGIVWTKFCDLRHRHDECEKDNVLINIENISDGGWCVSVTNAESDVADVHFVCECHDSCPGCKLYCDKCNTCAQKYRCTCLDNAMKSNMCKHIHALCMHLNSEGEQVDGVDFVYPHLANLLQSEPEKIDETTDSNLCNIHTCDSKELIEILASPKCDSNSKNILALNISHLNSACDVNPVES